MLTNMFLVMGLMLIADVCSQRITLRATHLGDEATCDVHKGLTNSVFVAFQWSWMRGFKCQLSTEKFHKASFDKGLWGNLIQRTLIQRTNHGDYQSLAENDTPPVSRSTSSYIPAVSSKPKTISNIPAVNSKPKTISIAVEQMNVIVSWHNSNVYIALGKDGGPVWLEEDKLMTSVQVEVFVDIGHSSSVDASSMVLTQMKRKLTMEENVYIVLSQDGKVQYFCHTVVQRPFLTITRRQNYGLRCNHSEKITGTSFPNYLHLLEFYMNPYELDVFLLKAGTGKATKLTDVLQHYYCLLGGLQDQDVTYERLKALRADLHKRLTIKTRLLHGDQKKLNERFAKLEGKMKVVEDLHEHDECE